MQIINKNTETRFAEDLKVQMMNAPTMRCMVFRSAQISGKPENWSHYLARSIDQCLQDNEAKIFLCHDDDVFVMSRLLTQKSLSLICEKFASFLFTSLGEKASDNIKIQIPHTSQAPQDETRSATQMSPSPKSTSEPPTVLQEKIEALTTLFEIGTSWKNLSALANKKIENLKILRRQQNQKTKETVQSVSRDETLGNIDQDLLSSLAMRRAMRERTEVMIVEDDPFSIKLVQNSLKGMYDLSMAHDGQGAILTYTLKAPDVLFLDIGLPDIDGHKVLEEIFKRDPDAYVVMLSGNGDKDNIMKAVQRGAKGFIGKPFTKEKLLQYIDRSPHILDKIRRNTQSA